MKSVIFFDIDGTLVSEDGFMTIPESTRTAISLARKNGCVTFINTGRTAFNVNKNVRSLGFNGIICGCGTYIEYNGDILLYNRLEQDFCRETAELMRKCGVTPVYEHKDGYFFDNLAPVNAYLEDFLKNFVEEGIDISRCVEDENFMFDKFVVWKNENCDFELFLRET